MAISLLERLRQAGQSYGAPAQTGKERDYQAKTQAYEQKLARRQGQAQLARQRAAKPSGMTDAQRRAQELQEREGAERQRLHGEWKANPGSSRTFDQWLSQRVASGGRPAVDYGSYVGSQSPLGYDRWREAQLAGYQPTRAPQTPRPAGGGAAFPSAAPVTAPGGAPMIGAGPLGQAAPPAFDFDRGVLPPNVWYEAGGLMMTTPDGNRTWVPGYDPAALRDNVGRGRIDPRVLQHYAELARANAPAPPANARVPVKMAGPAAATSAVADPVLARLLQSPAVVPVAMSALPAGQPPMDAPIAQAPIGVRRYVEREIADQVARRRQVPGFGLPPIRGLM